MAQSPEDAPLATGSMAGSEETLILPRQTRGGSNSRAFKIAGLTTLACLLLASQVFTAYMVFDQKQQIHTLQKNSEKMGKQVLRSAQAAPMRMRVPMSSLPLMMDYVSDVDTPSSKTPMTKLKEDAVPTVEKQLQDLMQDFKLPHFNKTFMANLQSLKTQMNESEWMSLETWMRYWLIFQMAQQKPPAPTPQPAFLIKTKCQMEVARKSHLVGQYKPQCDEQGRYTPMQCWHATNYCWCVDESGTAIEGTARRGHADCPKVPAYRRPMYAAMPLQKAFSLEEDAK
ncbi:CD74 molecule, major histocompatibility complex, class II invariant chain a [Sphaeramia orbicularis]|uniref:Thyroglobulin type-1 domain-containing protein n=1 Tax=Sphaeramia orbicularis TaxID=375764 RepID=A0A672YXC9_9TELE|nr:HLA class II histocompatibility antigen gamma chain [Sphaeramia orbicularis]